MRGPGPSPRVLAVGEIEGSDLTADFGRWRPMKYRVGPTIGTSFELSVGTLHRRRVELTSRHG